jgi:hypothetical protein
MADRPEQVGLSRLACQGELSIPAHRGDARGLHEVHHQHARRTDMDIYRYGYGYLSMLPAISGDRAHAEPVIRDPRLAATRR